MKISKENAEHYLWGDQCDGWHLTKGPELSVIQERMPAGTSETRHCHEKARQFFFLLSGIATMEMDGRETVLGPREGIEIPPGVPHRIRNDSEADAEFLVVSQPTTRGDRIVVD